MSNADKFQLGQVCKSWREVSRDPILWRHFDSRNLIWHRKPESYDNQVVAVKRMLKLTSSTQSKNVLKSIHCNAQFLRLQPTEASLFTPYIQQSSQLSSVSLKGQCLSEEILEALFKPTLMNRLDLTGIIDVTSREKISYSEFPEFICHPLIANLSIPFDIHACPLNNQQLAEQFKTRFPQLQTLCLSNSPQLTWDEAQAAYDVFKQKGIELSFSDCPIIIEVLVSKMDSNTLTNEDIDTPWLTPILFDIDDNGRTSLMWALGELSNEGGAGIAIVNKILQKFIKQNREELFQVDNNGSTALTWAIDKLSHKGEAGIAIINTILKKFLEQNRDELFRGTLSGETALTLALYKLSDKGPEGLKIINTILKKF